MAIPVEGCSIIARKDRIQSLLVNGTITSPNLTFLADDWICRWSFMTEEDARDFLKQLQDINLNTVQGPDPDVVLVDEHHQLVEPYCEWLQVGTLEKAVIAWMMGTDPGVVVAREGWDPKVGSGFLPQGKVDRENLEFLRLENNVEVYLDKATGRELFIGRTSTPVQALFETAARTIMDNLVSAGEPPVEGDKAAQVAEAVGMLERALAAQPGYWNAHWFNGKGQLALGRLEPAYDAFKRAFEIEKEVEAIPRELCGVCLELGRFEEAVEVGEQAAALDPQNAGTIGNLALAYLFAGRLDESLKSITAACGLDPDDSINQFLKKVIEEVRAGARPQPGCLADLRKPAPAGKRKFWQFWKK